MTCIRLIAAIAVFGIVSASEPAFAQKAKDTLRVGLVQSIESVSYYLDPSRETSFHSEAVFDTLVAYDEQASKLEPLLSSAWTKVDPQTIDFDLREDVKWHDGAAFTADDVVYTYTYINDPATKLRSNNWDYITRAEKLGLYKVRLIFRQPTSFDVTRLAFLNSMLPTHSFGPAKDKSTYMATKPVGTGMYRVVEINRNKHVLFERNPDYRHGGTVKPASNVGKIEFIPMPDTSTQVAQFLVGGLDLLRDPPLDQALELAKKPGVVISLSQGTSYSYLAIDAKGRSGIKPLTDVRVRRAMMMAVNRADLAQLALGGQKVDRVPEAMCWRFQDGCDYSQAPYPFDLAAARKLLEEAGYGDGFDLSIMTSTAPSQKALATAFASRLIQIGIRASVDPRELPSYRKSQTDGKIQAILTGWSGGDADVSGVIDTFYAAPESRDYHGDAILAALARESSSQTDPAARREIGRKLFDRSMEMAYFTTVAPYPLTFLHTDEVVLKTGTFNGYGVVPQGINWR